MDHAHLAAARTSDLDAAAAPFSASAAGPCYYYEYYSHALYGHGASAASASGAPHSSPRAHTTSPPPHADPANDYDGVKSTRRAPAATTTAWECQLAAEENLTLVISLCAELEESRARAAALEVGRGLI